MSAFITDGCTGKGGARAQCVHVLRTLFGVFCRNLSCVDLHRAAYAKPGMLGCHVENDCIVPMTKLRGIDAVCAYAFRIMCSDTRASHAYLHRTVHADVHACAFVLMHIGAGCMLEGLAHGRTIEFRT